MSATGDLYKAWYDAVVQAFGLSPHSFLLSRSLIPLGSTSRHLWDYFDSVPLESDGRYYEPQLFNRFSDGYGAMVNVIIPQAGTVWRDAVGDHYSQWVGYLAASPPIPAGGMLELFTKWAEINIPDPQRAQTAITAYSQIINGVVPVAQDRFIKAAGVYAYSLSIDQARDQVRKGAASRFSFNSNQPAAAARQVAPPPLPPVPPVTARLAAARLPTLVTAKVQSALAKLTASRVEGKARFDHQTGVWAAPLQMKETVGSLPYPAWFSASALNYARQTPGAPVWPLDQKPTWEQTFGPTGNLRRLVTSVVLVDGVDVELISDADLGGDEQSALEQAAAAGVTPLFAIPTPAERKAAGLGLAAAPSLSVAPAKSGESISIHISSPLGNTMLFGVVAVAE